jgi:hypothetical protein
MFQELTMRKPRSRITQGTLATIVTLAALPALVQCNKMPGGGMPGMPGGGSCPSSVDDIAKANFGLAADVEGKVKAGLSASASLQEIAANIEGDVTAACAGLAKDLGASDKDLEAKDSGPGKKAEAACNAAAKLIGEVKAKAKGTVTVIAKPPRCAASMDAMADCAASCDATVKPGSAEVKCEGGKLSGSCDAECKGTCSVEAGGKCEGSCSGECKGDCEAGFSGKCDGKCDGTCEGKTSKGGKCDGTCEGKCTGGASGSCSGSCKGSCSASCDVEAKGKCEGTCTGECSVQMKAPKCTGEVKPPEMSADCKASCDAKVSAKVECSPASVEVKIAGAADAEAATKLKAALSKNLPVLFKVTLGMKDNAAKAAAGVKASLEGVGAAVKGGGAAALKVGPCIAAAIDAQVKASASINVSVSASASASGSASSG